MSDEIPPVQPLTGDEPLDPPPVSCKKPEPLSRKELGFTCNEEGIPYERPKVGARAGVRKICGPCSETAGMYKLVRDKETGDQYREYEDGRRVLTSTATQAKSLPTVDRGAMADRIIDHYNKKGYAIINLPWTNWSSTPEIVAVKFKWWKIWKLFAYAKAQNNREKEIADIKQGIDQNKYTFDQLNTLLEIAFGNRIETIKAEIGPI
jgi:hypothetical protein